jgi:hypothetical protein
MPKRGVRCEVLRSQSSTDLLPDLQHVDALVPATTVRPIQRPAKPHVDEVDHAEAHAAADGDPRSQMESEEEPAAGEDGVALIEDIEEDSADYLKLLMRRPNRRKSHSEAPSPRTELKFS